MTFKRVGRSSDSWPRGQKRTIRGLLVIDDGDDDDDDSVVEVSDTESEGEGGEGKGKARAKQKVKPIRVIITSYGVLASEHAKTDKGTSQVFESKLMTVYHY